MKRACFCSGKGWKNPWVQTHGFWRCWESVLVEGSALNRTSMPLPLRNREHDEEGREGRHDPDTEEKGRRHHLSMTTIASWWYICGYQRWACTGVALSTVCHGWGSAHGALPFSIELFATSRWSLFLVLYLQGAHQPPADSSKPKVDQMDLIKLSGSQNKGKPHECEEVVCREDGGGGDKRGWVMRIMRMPCIPAWNCQSKMLRV